MTTTSDKPNTIPYGPSLTPCGSGLCLASRTTCALTPPKPKEELQAFRDCSAWDLGAALHNLSCSGEPLKQ